MKKTNDIKTSNSNISSRNSCSNNGKNGNLLDSLTVTTLLLDSHICRANIGRMAASARRHGVKLRPHLKTHQSRTIADCFREECGGVTSATVSSLTMARYFATTTTTTRRSTTSEEEEQQQQQQQQLQQPWRDLTVAFPFNMHEIDIVNELLQLPNGMRLGLTIENKDALEVLLDRVQFFNSSQEAVTVAAADESGSSSSTSSSSVLRVWIKVDAGYHRTGIPVDNIDEIRALLRRVAETQQQLLQLLQDQRPQAVRLEIGGMLLHSGHSYNVRRSDDDDDNTNNFAAAAADVRAQTLDDIHQDALQKVHRVLHQQLCHEFPDLEYSMGDTPCCSQIAFEDERLGATATEAAGRAYCYGDDKQQVVTEIRPGNFVFYDVMQYYIGCIPNARPDPNDRH